MNQRPSSVKMYSTMVPVLLMASVIMWVTRHGVQQDVTPLIRAQKVKELAFTSMSLMLTQDDASKAMMLDPENTRSGARKIKAYDANQIVLHQIREISQSPAINLVLNQMSEMEDKDLREIDTAVLEAFGDGHLEEAKHMYFSRFEPARARYEALARNLVAMATAGAGDAANRLHQADAWSQQYMLGALSIGTLAIGVWQFFLLRLIR